jgi:hypothetical protein
MWDVLLDVIMNIVDNAAAHHLWAVIGTPSLPPSPRAPAP